MYKLTDLKWFAILVIARESAGMSIVVNVRAMSIFIFRYVHVLMASYTSI